METPTDPDFAIVVYIGSVDCGVVVPHKHVLWGNFELFPSEHLKGLVCVFLPPSNWSSLVNHEPDPWH